MKKRTISLMLSGLLLFACTGQHNTDRILYPFSDFEFILPFECKTSHGNGGYLGFTPKQAMSLNEMKIELEKSNYYVAKKIHDNNCHDFADNKHKLNEFLIIGYNDEVKSYIECFILNIDEKENFKNNDDLYSVRPLNGYFNNTSFPYPKYLFTRKYGYVESKDDEMYKYGFENEGSKLDDDYYGYYDLTIDGTFEDIVSFYKHSVVENLQIDYDTESLVFNFEEKKIKMFFFEHEGMNYVGSKLIYES